MTKKTTQRTPNGMEIPIPTRDEVFRALTKIARPRPKKADHTEVVIVDTELPTER